MGADGCHLLTELRARWKHLMRLRAYDEERWAREWHAHRCLPQRGFDLGEGPQLLGGTFFSHLTWR